RLLAGVGVRRLLLWRHLAALCPDFQQLLGPVLFDSLVCANVGAGLFCVSRLFPGQSAFSLDIPRLERLGEHARRDHLVRGAMDKTPRSALLAYAGGGPAEFASGY